jgi:hypothetical protein
MNTCAECGRHWCGIAYYYRPTIDATGPAYCSVECWQLADRRLRPPRLTTRQMAQRRSERRASPGAPEIRVGRGQDVQAHGDSESS